MGEAGHSEQEQELGQILQRVLVRSLDTVEHLPHNTVPVYYDRQDNETKATQFDITYRYGVNFLLACYVTNNLDQRFSATRYRYPVILKPVPVTVIPLRPLHFKQNIP
jgi:hypothetical protein